VKDRNSANVSKIGRIVSKSLVVGGTISAKWNHSGLVCRQGTLTSCTCPMTLHSGHIGCMDLPNTEYEAEQEFLI
jgi:hypothetical protein